MVFIWANRRLKIDGFAGVLTIEGINRFRKVHFGSSESRVELGGKTFGESKKYDPLTFSAPVVAPNLKSSNAEKMDPSKMNRDFGKSIDGDTIKRRLYGGTQ